MADNSIKNFNLNQSNSIKIYQIQAILEIFEQVYIDNSLL